MTATRMDDAPDQLYSSTAHLIPNEDRALAAQLAQSVGLIADWHLVRYHPRICCTLLTCLLMIVLQIGIGTAGYLTQSVLTKNWWFMAINLAETFNFLLILLVYALHNRFLVALKSRGYLLILPSFKCLRRVPLIIGCLYMAVNFVLLNVLQLECPNALVSWDNNTCENSQFLDHPHTLYFYVCLVGEGALLICAYAFFSLRVIRFHRRASRGRILPDVLAELAELNINAGLGVPGLGSPSGRTATESTLPSRGSVPTDRPPLNIPINTSPEVMEVHSRIVDIIDRPGNNESLSRIVMERQADLLFYMHQRIECLQEELAVIYRNQQAA